MLTANINTVWASLIVEELIRNGVTHFLICPGSRSTPLVAAVADNPCATAIVHTDERGAAFYALGYAKATGEPAAIITTSGTAVANCLPAVIEASQSFLPLIVLSADRPPELRDTGANQTIQQPGIFKNYVRWEFDLPCPTTDIPAHFVLNRVDVMIRHAVGKPCGPVHLNCQLREPLTNRIDGHNYQPYLAYLQRWMTQVSPWIDAVEPAPKFASPSALDPIETLMNREKAAVIVGALGSEEDREAVAACLRNFAGPVFSDIQAGLRTHEQCYVGHYDWLLENKDLVCAYRPDVVIHIGDRIVSKRLQRALAEWAREQTAIVRLVDHQQIDDSVSGIHESVRVTIPTGEFARYEAILPRGGSDLLTKKYEAAFDAMHQVFLKELYDGNLTELAVAHSLCTAITGEYDLFAASSMAVRLLDMVAIDVPQGTRIAANRGASGIDGTIASTCGFITGQERPAVLFIGDQAVLHDLNSLFFIRQSQWPLIIVILNNNGGGIFEYLPIGEEQKLCEDFFVAPHHMHFEHAAQQFSIPYTRVTELADFTHTLGTLFRDGQSAILEVMVDRGKSREQMNRILEAARHLSIV